MGSVAVVPGEVERQVLPESEQTIGYENQAPGALALHGPDAPLDHREAPVLSNGPESVLNAPPTAPAVESPRRELNALISDQVSGTPRWLPESYLQESPNSR